MTTPKTRRTLCVGFLLAALLPFCVPSSVSQTPPPSATISPADTGCCGPITASGQHMLQVLERMDVEHLWLANTKVHWRTGEPRSGHGHTHCSAFAAAAGERFGIYMLRPPQHSADLLASAQGRWFESERGRHDGWRPVTTSLEAQQLANQGVLVILVFINPDAHVPGHVAVVRPAVKSAKALAEEGPQTIQAGLHNFSNGTAVQSFAHHKGAWPTQVRMYAHEIDFEAPLPPPSKNEDVEDDK